MAHLLETNIMELTQHEKIFIIMLRHYKEYQFARAWSASEFQTEQSGIFIGYEASARISELISQYQFAFEIGKSGRFRTIKLRTDNFYSVYKNLPHDLAKHMVLEGIIK